MSLFFFLGSPGAQYTAYRGLSRRLDPADWSSAPTFRLEVHAFTSIASFDYQARLYNVTDGAPVSGSEISSVATTLTRLRSGSFALPSGAKTYEVQYGGVVGGVYTTEDAVLIGDVAG